MARARRDGGAGGSVGRSDAGKPDDGKLTEYQRRRRFDRTTEPSGSDAAAEAGGRPVFVVQLHDASRMHFDFRLEADGVLKSWAVPKGPSTDPHVKRFAARTEDHPLDYRTFEGVIAKGEYGGGTVMVWDEGTFVNLTTDRSGEQVPLGRAVEQGHASFRLEGHKLHGDYALTRMRGEDEKESWLLVKKSDRHAKADKAADPQRLRSALSGRTLRRIAADADAEVSSGAGGGGNGGGGSGRAGGGR